jgi:hypothetical protein
MFSAHEIVQFLKSSQTQYLFLPLVIAFVTGFIKAQSRPPSNQKFCWEDLAVGFDLTITAIFGLATYAIYLIDLPPNISPQNQTEVLAAIGPIEGVLVFFLWGIAVIVSGYGWEKNREKINWLGITLPLSLAVVALRQFALFIF